MISEKIFEYCSILSAENGVIEMNNVKIETDDQNCIHSKPRKDAFKLKQELSLRIAAKRKEELQKKQMSTVKIPLEDSDSDCEIQCGEVGKPTENSCDVNNGNNKENYESDVGEENEDEEGNGDQEGTEDIIELNDGDDSNAASDENDEFDEEEVEAAENEEVESIADGCGSIKTKQRKRIILMDNSDDDEDGMEKLQDSMKSEDLNTTSISLDESQFPSEVPVDDKTMSQISKNQSRADQMIDSCGKIVPEHHETNDNDNLATLFTQTADSMSVTELLDLCSGSFVTQETNVSH